MLGIIPFGKFFCEYPVILWLLLFFEEPPNVFYFKYDPVLLLSLAPLKGENAVPVTLN